MRLEFDKENFVSSLQKKKATVLRMETDDMVNRFGVDAIVTYCLTLKEFLSRDEAERRWHSLHTNLFSQEFECGVHVVERAPTSGRLHWHGATVLKSHEDVRTGFAWDPYWKWKSEVQKGRTANRGLKRKLMREVMEHATDGLRKVHGILSPKALAKYGFGHAHVTPIQKNAEAFAFYMAKYLSKKPSEKAQGYKEEDKGRRSFRIWGKKRVCDVRHSPNTERSANWRKRVRFAGQIIGELVNGEAWSHDDFANNMGKRWCYYMKPWISGIPIKYINYRENTTFELMQSLAAGRSDPCEGFPEGRSPWYVCGRNNEQRIMTDFMSWYTNKDFVR